MYEMQVKIKEGTTNREKWVSVCPSNTQIPYRYESKTEAEHMLNICYPESSTQTRIIEVV